MLVGARRQGETPGDVLGLFEVLIPARRWQPLDNPASTLGLPCVGDSRRRVGSWFVREPVWTFAGPAGSAVANCHLLPSDLEAPCCLVLEVVHGRVEELG